MGCLKLSYYPTTELKIISDRKVLTYNKTEINNRSSYLYGFGSQEKDDEISGAGNHTTATFWEYDTRLGRRWNRDPKPNTSISEYACFANNPIFYVDINGDTLGISGSQTNQDAFLAQINTGETKFKIGTDGNLALDNSNAKVVGQFATQMVAAINNTQKVNVPLVDASNSIMIDAFATGKVDMGDMLAGTNDAFKDNVLHFVNERFDVSDYEKNKGLGMPSSAHSTGISAEEKFIKELNPRAVVKFQSEGEDISSLIYNSTTGVGSINYIFNFTDVKLIFQMQVVKDPSTNRPTMSNVVQKNYFEAKPTLVGPLKDDGTF